MMDDDPLEFEIDREGVRQYLAGVWIFALCLLGFGFAMVLANIVAHILFGRDAFFPALVLSVCFGAGIALIAVRLAHRIASAGAATQHYWIDAGGNLRVNSGLLFRSRISLPLDRIGHIILGQGPLTSWCGIWAMKVQNAGGQGPESPVTLLGLKSPEKVRDILLDERRKALREIQAERYA
jgi:membrane protein YdbS with pleckstrin-like domain